MSWACHASSRAWKAAAWWILALSSTSTVERVRVAAHASSVSMTKAASSVPSRAAVCNSLVAALSKLSTLKRGL